MSGPAHGELINDMIASRLSADDARAHAKNSFALDHGLATRDDTYAKAANVDVEAVGDRTSSVVERETYPVPTEHEASTLRKVADSIPKTAYLLCVVELAERASYYGVKSVFSNYLQFDLPTGGNGAGSPAVGTQDTAGALGQGLQFSNAFILLFTFLAYVIPVGGAWLADTKLGRMKTILLGVLIGGVSHIIMICGAIPSVLQAGKGLAPFIVSLLLLALGAGLFKPNVVPTVLDQYKHQRAYIKELPSGERVVVDPESTVQRIMLWFYAFINIGAFFAIASTYSEKYVGFWLAYLVPGVVYFLLPVLLWYLYPRLTKYPPDGSALDKAWKVITMAFKESKGVFWKESFWFAAMPSKLAEKGITTFNKKPITWTDKDVDDIRRSVVACGVFLYFPIYSINDGGVGSVATSQGSTMTTNGAPNDLLNHFNPLVIIIFIPFLSHVVYPALRKYNIRFGRISRISFGFLLAAISGAIGAIVQWRIYETSPCGYHATDCAIGTGVSPLSIWLQIPNVTLGALSECFCNVTAYELAYARAPEGMKSLIMALFLFSTALSSALGEVLSPVTKDPYLIWIWAGPAIALFVQTIIFWFRYRKYDDDEFMTYEEPSKALKVEERVSSEMDDSERAQDGAQDKDEKR